MTDLKVAHRQQCVDKLDFQSGKSLWFAVFAYFCGIITPTMGLQVLECTCSSAGYQATPAYHCWNVAPHLTLQLLPLFPLPTPILCYWPCCSPVMPDMHLLHRILHLHFLQLEYSSEYMQVCLLFLIFLKSSQMSSMTCQYKFAIFPHLLNIPFFCYVLCFIIFWPFPTYYNIYCILLALPSCSPPLEQEHFLP